MLRRILQDTTGASAIEYAVIAALISVAAIGAFYTLGQASNDNLTKVDAAYRDGA